MSRHHMGRVAAVALLGAAPAVLGAQDAGAYPVIGLEEARRRSLTVAPDAVTARTDVDKAVWERRSAFARLITPDVTARGDYQRFSEPFFNIGTFTQSPTAASATLEANLVVLGAGRLGAYRSSRATLASAEASETATRFRAELETDRAYFAVIAERELARVASDRLRRAEQQFAIARVRVQAGESIASDSLQLLLEVNRARLAILKSDSALAGARLGLGRRVGLARPVDALPADTVVPATLPMTEMQAVTEYLERGPELTASRASERRADALVDVEREHYLPQVAIGASRTAFDTRFYPSGKLISLVGLNVSLPIWNGGVRELSIARARADYTVARATRADQERGAGETVSRAYHGYTTARASIELARVGVAAASENFRVQQARYREGATTILDLLEAQLALSDAESALVQSRYATQLALAQIEALLGRRVFAGGATNGNDR